MNRCGAPAFFVSVALPGSLRGSVSPHANRGRRGHPGPRPRHGARARTQQRRRRRRARRGQRPGRRPADAHQAPAELLHEVLLPAVRGLDARGELPGPAVLSAALLRRSPHFCSVPRSRRPRAAPAPAARCPIPTLRFVNAGLPLTGSACLLSAGHGRQLHHGSRRLAVRRWVVLHHVLLGAGPVRQAAAPGGHRHGALNGQRVAGQQLSVGDCAIG